MTQSLYNITDELVAVRAREVTAISYTGKDIRGTSSPDLELFEKLAIITPTPKPAEAASLSRIDGFGIKPTAESQVLKHGLQIKDASATNAAHELGAVNANKDANKESRRL